MKRAMPHICDEGSVEFDAPCAEEDKASNSRVPGFISKTFDIFSNQNHSHLCGWSGTGGTIVIHKITEFASVVLPKYFKHSNYASFVRQLNMYDFHKTVANPQIAEFHHPSFLKNRRDLLHNIKRKSRRDGAETKQVATQPTTPCTQTHTQNAHDLRLST